MKLGFWKGMGKGLSLGFGALASQGAAPDVTAPTVVITSSESSPTDTSPIPITITFSEEVTGFEVGDLTIANCTAGDFATADNIVFTANLTPSAGVSQAITVDIGAGVCADAAGNANLAADQLAITYIKPFSETFTADDDTTLASRVSDSGHTWTVHTGTFKTVSNHLEPNSHTDGDIATVDYPHYDYLYEVLIRPFLVSAGIKSIAGVVFRFEDASNFWVVQLDDAAGTKKLYLFKRVAGTYTEMASPVVTWASGTQYKISILTSGSNINIFVDDVEKIALTGQTALQTATRVGVRLGKTGAPADTCEWDTLTI